MDILSFIVLSYAIGVLANLILLVDVFGVDYSDFKEYHMRSLGVILPFLSWISFVILVLLLLLDNKK